MYVHTCIYTYTYTAHIHIHIHVHTYTCIYVCTHPHLPRCCAASLQHEYIYYIHINIWMYVHTCTNIYTYTYKYTYMHTCIHAYTRTHLPSNCAASRCPPASAPRRQRPSKYSQTSALDLLMLQYSIQGGQDP